jgi:hypothetical protein
VTTYTKFYETWVSKTAIQAGLSKAEIRRNHPDRKQEWFWHLEDCIKQGAALSKKIADNVAFHLSEHNLQHLLRLHDHAAPKDYMMPSAQGES